MSHKYTPPPFGNLSLSTKHRGGLYAGCDNFSHDYAFPSGHEVIVGGGGGGGQALGGEMLPTLAERLTSFSVEGEGGGRFREVAGVSIVDVGGLC